MIKTALVFCLISFNVFAIKPVTKIINIEGDVLIKNLDGTISPATINMELNEGTYIRTAKSSKIDLEFFDKTLVTVGPNALFKIQSFTTETPGILALIRGEIRSKVTKEYMDIEDKNKSKLFIRTKTAAMGVRGTEFKIDYSEENEKTTLVTFEGKVAFNKLEKYERNRELNQQELDSILERRDRIMVERGHSTMVDKRSNRPEKLRKIEDKTLEKLKEQPIIKTEERKEVLENNKKPELDFKDDISMRPPPVDNQPLELKKDVRKEMRKEDRLEPKREMKRENRIEDRKEDSTIPTKLPSDSTGTVIKN